jgi:4-amino-4-deoxy-L-arabinose transferase-like glycosyltransferase
VRVLEDAAEAPAETSEQPAGTRGRWARPPALVWVITALHVALMVMCTFLYPPFSNYDEHWHVDMVQAYYDGNGPYDPGERTTDRGVQQIVRLVPVPKPATAYSEVPLPDRGDRSSVDDLQDGQPSGNPVPNQMVQHPPLYYLLGAGLLHVVPGGDDLPFDWYIAVLRLLSIAMMAPLPLLAWATARRLLGDGPLAVAAAVVPLTIPNLARVGASVNNDNLLTLLASALMFVLAGVLAGDLRKRTGLLAGILLGLALLTKGMALGLPPVVLAAYVVSWLRHRAPLRTVLPPLGIAALASLIGAWWWVRNVIVYGTVQPSGLPREWVLRTHPPLSPGESPREFAVTFADQYTLRFWASIGLPDVPRLPVPLSRAWLVVLAIGILVGLAIGLKGRFGRATLGVLVLPAVLITAIVAAGSYNGYQDFGRVSAAQGRYIYCAVTALAVVAVVGWGRLDPTRGRLLTVVLLVAGLATQVVAWRLILLSWWAPRVPQLDGIERLRGAFVGVFRWSPVPRPVTIAVFAAVAVLSLVVVALAARQLFGRTRAAGAPEHLRL